jgi:hypothetical protein
MMTMSETNDPFADFETVGEVFGFVYRKAGMNGVKQFIVMGCDQPVPAKPWLLTQAERIKITTAESLERAADELQSAGLTKVAKVVSDHAASRPREIDLPTFEPGTVNHRAWLAMMQRKRV